MYICATESGSNGQAPSAKRESAPSAKRRAPSAKMLRAPSAKMRRAPSAKMRRAPSAKMRRPLSAQMRARAKCARARKGCARIQYTILGEHIRVIGILCYARWINVRARSLTYALAHSVWRLCAARAHSLTCTRARAHCTRKDEVSCADLIRSGVSAHNP